eukprot:2045687-Amphidinium_carterae.1
MKPSGIRNTTICYSEIATWARVPLMHTAQVRTAIMCALQYLPCILDHNVVATQHRRCRMSFERA